jgi:hypothetical protein
MEDLMSGGTPPGDLKFDKADYGEKRPAASCVACRQEVRGAYYEVNGKIVCVRCKQAVELARDRGSNVGRFFTATLYGSLAAGIGSAVWYAVRALTHVEFGLLAIVVGALVGGAVKKGSAGRGGWPYQALAMFLTYASIVSTYVPLIVKSAIEQQSNKTSATSATKSGAAPELPAAPGASVQPGAKPKGGVFTLLLGLAVLFGLAFALPFLLGFQNLIGLLIIGIGLYEAWKINRRVQLVISGPYSVSAAPPASG